MNDYNKNTFWNCKNEETGETKYYMKINDLYVEVSKDVYAVCFNSYRKALRDTEKNEKYGILSLDQQNENGTTLMDCIKSNDNTADIALRNIMIESIKNVIASLNDLDKCIIKSFLFDGKSEREIAEEMNLKRDAVHYRKQKFLEKLKNIFPKTDFH